MDGGYDKHLRMLRKTYAEQVRMCQQAVARYFPEGTKVTRPVGGFLLWVELPGKVDSLELFRQALDNGISIAPGVMFSARQRHRSFIRLNCGLRWDGEVEQALMRLGTLAETSG